MQYGRFRTNYISNLEVNAASIGELLESEFEKRLIPIELPMAADWGYTFRARIGKQLVDVFVIDQDEDGYGIALEPPKDIFSWFFSHEQKKAIESVKSILSEILFAITPGSTLIWYSKDEWLATFDTDFW